MANQVQLLMYEGFLAGDPELRYTPAGKAVTNFRMGSNRQYKNSEGEIVKETTWLKVTVWGKLGEIVNQYCGKGSHVIVEGILRVGENGSPNVYELKAGGWGASYEVTAEKVRILKGKDGAAPVSGDAVEPAVTDDEIPF
jgi:single-strand DNA-binding protein